MSDLDTLPEEGASDVSISVGPGLSEVQYGNLDSWSMLIGPGNGDTLAVLSPGVGSGTVSVRLIQRDILSGEAEASDVYKVSDRWLPTVLESASVTDYTFLLASNLDLFAIRTAHNPSGFVELKVLSAESDYTTVSLEAKTPVRERDAALSEFMLTAELNDLYVLKQAHTASYATDINGQHAQHAGLFSPVCHLYILDAANKYASFRLQVTVPLQSAAGARKLKFALMPDGNMAAIDTASEDVVQISVLGASDQFQSIRVKYETALPSKEYAAIGFDRDEGLIVVEAEEGVDDYLRVSLLQRSNGYLSVDGVQEVYLFPVGEAIDTDGDETAESSVSEVEGDDSDERVLAELIGVWRFDSAAGHTHTLGTCSRPPMPHDESSGGTDSDDGNGDDDGDGGDDSGGLELTGSAIGCPEGHFGGGLDITAGGLTTADGSVPPALPDVSPGRAASVTAWVQAGQPGTILTWGGDGEGKEGDETALSLTLAVDADLGFLLRLPGGHQLAATQDLLVQDLRPFEQPAAWHHVAVIVDKMARLYVNGYLVQQLEPGRGVPATSRRVFRLGQADKDKTGVAATAAADDDDDAALGRGTSQAQGRRLVVDDVAVFLGALETSEVRAVMAGDLTDWGLPPLADVLHGLWRFDRPNDAGHDSRALWSLDLHGSGSSHPAKVAAAGVHDGALYCEPGDGYLETRLRASMDEAHDSGHLLPSGGDAYTVAGWVYPDKYGEMVVASMGQGNVTTALMVRYDALGHVTVLHSWGDADDAGGAVLIAGPELVAERREATTRLFSWAHGAQGQWGRWLHVAATFDGSRRSIWVNGAVIASDGPTPAAVRAHVVSGEATVGGSEGAALDFEGFMDDVVIFSAALNSREMALVTQGRFAEWSVVESYGWELVLQVADDEQDSESQSALFGFDSPLWTNDDLLQPHAPSHTHSSSLLPQNRKLPSFLHTRFHRMRLCVGAPFVDCITHGFGTMWDSAKALFSAGQQMPASAEVEPAESKRFTDAFETAPCGTVSLGFNVRNEDDDELAARWGFFMHDPSLPCRHLMYTPAPGVVAAVGLGLKGAAGSVVGAGWTGSANEKAQLRQAWLYVQPATYALAALYRFDDGSDLGADSSIHNNRLLEVGTLHAAMHGRYRGALRLDADSPGYLIFNGEFAQLPMHVPRDDTPYTIMAWIRPENHGAVDVASLDVVGWGSPGVANGRTALRLEGNNGLSVVWSPDADDNLLASDAVVAAAAGDMDDQRRWRHVAATYDGTMRRLWIDGEAVASDEPAKAHACQDTHFFVGAFESFLDNSRGAKATGGKKGFSGLIDDVAIFNVALTSDQISQGIQGDFSQFGVPGAAPASSLGGLWRFDDPLAPGADSSSWRSTLQLNPPTPSGQGQGGPPEQTPDGRFAGAMAFGGGRGGRGGGGRGGDGFLTPQGGDFVPAPRGLPVNDHPYTLAAWVSTSAGAADADLVSWGAMHRRHGANYLRILAGGRLSNSWEGNSLTAPADAASIADGRWHHVAATYDGTRRALWVDGVQVAADLPPPDVLAVQPNYFRLGWSHGHEHDQFRGRLDDVAIFSVALNPPQLERVLMGDFAEWGLIRPATQLRGLWQFDVKDDLGFDKSERGLHLDVSESQSEEAPERTHGTNEHCIGGALFNADADGLGSFLEASGPKLEVPVPSSVAGGATFQYSLSMWLMPTALDGTGAGRPVDALQWEGGLLSWGSGSSPAAGDDAIATTIDTQTGTIRHTWHTRQTHSHIDGHTHRSVLEADAAVPPGDWAHLAVTFDGVERRVWVNGEIVASDQPDRALLPAMGSPDDNGASSLMLRVGAAAGADVGFVGELDQVAVFAAALSRTQVESLVSDDLMDWEIEIDSDGDLTPDCLDDCPYDAAKANAGLCGCSVPETDQDGDLMPDCLDACAADPDKSAHSGICGCGFTEVDSDGDGIVDCVDECPGDPNKVDPGVCGCGMADVDGDGDGSMTCEEDCPEDPLKTMAGVCGCGVPDVDSDGDGALDCVDECPQSAAKTVAGTCGCNATENDADEDGTPDCTDECPMNPLLTAVPGACGCDGMDSDGDGVYDCEDGCAHNEHKTEPDDCGCANADRDGDGTCDLLDLCPDNPDKTKPEPCGCVDLDSDEDGKQDCEDDCPQDPRVWVVRVGATGYKCTCGAEEIDADADGVSDCDDECPNNAQLSVKGDCGCSSVDADADGELDCEDECPADAIKDIPGICGCHVADVDSDHDGTLDCHEDCPDDESKTKAGDCGCGVPDTDSDGDGATDCVDGCPTDGHKTAPGQCGCNEQDVDRDLDGAMDCVDLCPDDASKTEPGECGCGSPDVDGDSDGILDCADLCPFDQGGDPGVCGCGVPDVDLDGDKYADCVDECPSDADKHLKGYCGCHVHDVDLDADGVVDCVEECPSDPHKELAGVCGCGVAEIDSDADGKMDCVDECEADPYKTTAGVCGCGVTDYDGDGDGTMDCQESCPNDRLKQAPGVCGCGYVDADEDKDGVLDCLDSCPLDPLKVDDPGACGCGMTEEDSDGDGVVDCFDLCPDDPLKAASVGLCGCNAADTDTDSDGLADCIDACPLFANPDQKVDVCGCGTGFNDADGDGVVDCVDGCPLDPHKTRAGVCNCGAEDIDTDGDGVADCAEACQDDPLKTDAGHCGCGSPDKDSDDDGVMDCHDTCPFDPLKTAGGICGCGVADVDTDADGVANCAESCPYDASKQDEGDCGCGRPDVDSDSDGTLDCLDACPNDANKVQAGACGCGVPDVDADGDGTTDCQQCEDSDPSGEPKHSDSDGVADCADACPYDAFKSEAGVCGCGRQDADSDHDGLFDCVDSCPADGSKVRAGICGCGFSENDSDGDGVLDCNDSCPDDAAKTESGSCGCGFKDTDSDGDGIPDCLDVCVDDPAKFESGMCGCHVAELDSDADGTPDCHDSCPHNALKTQGGVCGCGVPDVDSDGDGTPDCVDACPERASKDVTAGQCGCGGDDVDSDGDGVLDCVDACPQDKSKVTAGECGCGQPDSDTDGDGAIDCRDLCPTDPAKSHPGVCGCGDEFC